MKFKKHIINKNVISKIFDLLMDHFPKTVKREGSDKKSL